MTLEQRIEALERTLAARAAAEQPVSYYTSRYSGEEIDERLSLWDMPQLALANLGAGVRPNEIDNPRLDINQQGQSSYNTLNAAGYGIDRWWSIFADYEVATKTLTSVGQQYGAALRQPLGNPSRFAGKTVTLTVWALSGSGTVGLAKSTGINSGMSSYGNVAINGAGLYSKTFTLTDDVGGDAYPYLIITVSIPIGKSIRFASPIPFKLEFGEGQTLAYQNSDGVWHLLPQPENSYSNELLNCRRYGESIIGGRAHGVATSESFVAVTYPFFAEKRAIPVLNTDKINLEKILFDNTAGTLVTPTAVSLRGPRKGGAVLGFTGAFTVGHEYSLISDRSGGYFDANL